MRAFRLSDPLPAGTTVLEASAGTGKTYAIAALAVRFLAEGRASVVELLLVTFSRAATAELRSRVRERLRASAAALASAVAGVEPSDPVDRLLADCPAEEVRVRADRLADAFTQFDRVTIMTTHEFCHGMIAGLGVLAAQEPQSTLVEDLRPLADEASADVYLRRYAHAERPPPFRWVDERPGDPGARTLGRDAVEVVGSLVPTDASGGAGERVAFAADVRSEVDRRKTQRRLFSFEDQLARLDAALSDPQTGPLACARLAARYPVVLVDEFQDTDPVQWHILASAFGAATTLVLIGDPKQAIYGFRGADVHTYTAAARSAGTATTLTTNYRSDGPVVDAVGALFRNLALGEDIGVPVVRADHVDSRLVSAPGTPWACGVQVRCVESDDAVAPWHADDRITADLVNVVAELLGPAAPLAGRRGPLRPRDVAILVRANRRGTELARALAAAGIPATFSGTHSVFASEPAAAWVTLLAALEEPRRPYLQRAVLTDFLGGSVAALATASDDDWAGWSLKLHTWARVLRRSGVPALLAALDADGFTPRLLRRAHGERDVTDHRHIAELLHGRFAGSDATIRDLLGWLRNSVADSSPEERTRRLETDADAVRIMTIHRAKGLQFPVVLLPEAATHRDPEHDDGRRLVLPAEGGRSLDLGGRAAPGRAQRWNASRLDESDEALRALYVGLTRAQSHAVAWWAHHWTVGRSPLHRLLHADHDAPEPQRPAPGYPPASPVELGWLRRAGIAAVAVPDAAPPPRSSAHPAPADLRARAWTRTIDQTWRRTSYSGLTARAHDLAHEPGFLDDEQPLSAASETVVPDELAARSPMAALPSGPAFGTLVHSLYERLDPRGADWRERLDAAATEALRAWPLTDVTPGALAEALAPSLMSPLGPLAEGTTLRDYGPGNRLAELDFEFALAAPEATLADIAALLDPHVADTPLAAYPGRLAGPALSGQALIGSLTGSIDGVLRLPSGAHLIVDYKTNRLGPAGLPPEDLVLGHYAPGALAEAMMASHYPLQALLYAVALHRFLRARLAGYDPEHHLAGTAYLFVRGMAGPQTPVIDGHPVGVFSWRPPIALVAGVSDLLAGGPR